MSDRKVILKMVMSLDGFVTSTDGTHEWMFEWFGDDSGEWNRRALEEAGVHAMGRRSYEVMGPHWAAPTGPMAPAGVGRGTSGGRRPPGAAPPGPTPPPMNEKRRAVSSPPREKGEWGPAEI